MASSASQLKNRIESAITATILKLKGNKRRTALLTVALAMAALGIGAGMLLNRQRQQAALLAIEQQSTVSVQREPLLIETEASGVVIATRRINISPAAPGRIRELRLREGDRVAKGQLLAIMENDEGGFRVGQLEAELEGAIAERDADKRRLSRFEELLREEAVSPDEVDELRKNLSRSTARIGETDQRLREAKMLLERSYIRAPFSGIITQLFAETSEFVAPATSASSDVGATSSTIAELSRGLEVQAKIPEASLLRVSRGQQVMIESDAFLGEAFTGVVSSISPRAVANDNVITFPVNIELKDGFTRLRPQMNVRVKFLGKQSDKQIMIPLAAVETQKDGKTVVYILGSTGKPEQRFISLGVVSGARVQIVHGLKEGERVFLTPTNQNQSKGA